MDSGADPKVCQVVGLLAQGRMDLHAYTRS